MGRSSHTCRTRRINLLTLAASLATADCAAAASVLPRGPSLSAAATGATPTTVHYHDAARSTLPTTASGTEPLIGDALPHDVQSLQVAHQRYEAALLIPIPFELLGGMIAATGEIAAVHQQLQPRSERESGITTLAARTQVPATAYTSRKAGVLYVPHFKEGAPRYFLAAQRLGDAGTAPVRDFTVGAKIAAADMPFAIKWNTTDRADLWLALTWRVWPAPHQRHTWLPALGYRWEHARGWSIEAEVPHGLTIGWHTSNDQWQVFASGRRETQLATAATVFGPAYVETAASAAVLGLRRRLGAVAPSMMGWYAAIEAGAREETSVYSNERGDAVATTRSNPAAVVQVKLGSVLPGSPPP